MPAGRPSDYNEETAAAICARLSDGEPLVKICRDAAMPTSSSVYLWLIKHQEFSEMYARAREDQADTLADQIIDIADETPMAYPEAAQEGEPVEIKFDASAVAHQRLRVDARKWVAAKLKPRKYGDKVTQEITGIDGGPVQTMSAAMSPEQAAHAYKQLMG